MKDFRRWLFYGCWLAVAYIFPHTVFAQCPVVNNVFGEGEQISYTVSYNWGPVWVNAGLVTFSAEKEMVHGRQAWHFKSTGKSYPSYDVLFKVRDYYDSWVDPETFHSVDFRRYTFEGGYSILNTLFFDQGSQRIISSTKCNNKPVRCDTLAMRACAFDMLSSIYYTRTLDFSDFRPGIKRDVTVLIDGAYYDIYIRSIGRETVESGDGKRYKCIKFAAKMVQGTIFKGEEDVLVWVTDDANKIPVYIEAKIIVGTIKAYLKEMKGLKNPVTSLVK
ncbi:MAG: DUF3108 domain-containing protein [Bacteroidota bacterium]